MSEDAVLRIFYIDVGKKQLVLEVSSDVDENMYRKLIEDCQVQIVKEKWQHKQNSYIVYDVKPFGIERFVKHYYLKGSDTAIKFLMHVLDPRCLLEKCYRNEPANRKEEVKRKRKRKKNNETSDNS